MKVNSATTQALIRSQELDRQQDKQQEVKRKEEAIRQEKLRVQRLEQTHPTKGKNIDVKV